MRKDVVSVVIPIYNVEKHLNRCIKSVVNQSYENIEIILVDDESPDNCPKICEEWAKKDARIKVIHKKNAGLGYARNTGIDHATGEFICFIDSDDYIALDTIEKAYNAAVKYKADIISYGYSQVKSNGEVRCSFIPNPEKLVFEGDEIRDVFLPDMIAPDTFTGKTTNIWMSMCGALFSMELITKNNWRLVSERNIISEDVYSLLCLYSNVCKVVVIPEVFYFYCENVTSLTHTYKTDRFEKIKHFYSECLIICDKFGYKNIVRQRLAYPFLSNTIAALKMITVSNQDEVEKIKMLRKVINDEMLQKVLHENSLKKEKKSRKILLIFMKCKWYRGCYVLLKMKTKG